MPSLLDFRTRMRNFFRLDTDELSDVVLDNIYSDTIQSLMNSIVKSQEMDSFKDIISSHIIVDLSTPSVVDNATYPVPKVTMTSGSVLLSLGNPIYTLVSGTTINMHEVNSIAELLNTPNSGIISKFIRNDSKSILINANSLGNVGKITWKVVDKAIAEPILQSDSTFDDFIMESGKNKVTEYLTKYNRR